MLKRRRTVAAVHMVAALLLSAVAVIPHPAARLTAFVLGFNSLILLVCAATITIATVWWLQRGGPVLTIADLIVVANCATALGVALRQSGELARDFPEFTSGAWAGAIILLTALVVILWLAISVAGSRSEASRTNARKS